jgi:hypothetical protein
MKSLCYAGLVFFITLLISVNAQTVGDRFEFTNISGIPLDDPDEFTAGHSFYTSAWRIFENTPHPDYFQSGLVSNWMAPIFQEGDESEYNTIEGGLGWWSDQRFSHEAPKFIMGGVSSSFYSWANGLGMGRDERGGQDGYRRWDDSDPQIGLYGVAQISNQLLWAPDGLNLAPSSNGELFGYGYIPLPLTDVMPTTAGQSVTTGNQSWTLFVNTDNFKGPVAFFLPTFWTKPVLEDNTLEGQFLDSRPAEPNVSWGIETASVPIVHELDASGTRFARVMPVLYPQTDSDEAILLNRPVVYNRQAKWDAMTLWFDGGEIAPTLFDAKGRRDILFDVGDEGGASEMVADIILMPNGENNEFDIDNSAYLNGFVKDAQSWGYRVNRTLLENSFKTPEYFRLDNGLWTPITKSEVPDSLSLHGHQFQSKPLDPQPLLTPMEQDGPWYDADGNGPWLSPGPVAGPYTKDIGDGSRLTYYWYRFIDQPAIIHANLPDDIRQKLQHSIELIHTHWFKNNEYLPPPTTGSLASLDAAIIVEPPSGLEIGYVPIVSRQEKRDDSHLLVSVSAFPSEAGSVSGKLRHTEGDAVSLTAIAESGYEFIQWTENGTEVSNDPSLSFMAETSRELVANFKANEVMPSMASSNSESAGGAMRDLFILLLLALFLNRKATT